MARGKYRGDNPKQTSSGRPGNNTKMASMNKNKRSSFKKYRGQG